MAYSRDKIGNIQDGIKHLIVPKSMQMLKNTKTHTHTNKLWVFVKGSCEPIGECLNDKSQNNLSKNRVVLGLKHKICDHNDVNK